MYNFLIIIILTYHLLIFIYKTTYKRSKLIKEYKSLKKLHFSKILCFIKNRLILKIDGTYSFLIFIFIIL